MMRAAIGATVMALIFLPTAGYGLTAAVEVDGYSFSLNPTGTSNGDTIFFTTFDGLSGVPLLDCDAVTCTVSDEVTPTFLGNLCTGGLSSGRWRRRGRG